MFPRAHCHRLRPVLRHCRSPDSNVNQIRLTLATENTLSRANLLNEIRYAERLCQRTARLYRRVQNATTFLTIIGGSAAASALVATAPSWLPILGTLLLAVFGAVAIAVRPADKAAQNELDVRRYGAIRVKSGAMSDAELRQAIDEANTNNAVEIEHLRDVAYNDVALEVGRPDSVVRLNLQQRLIAACA